MFEGSHRGNGITLSDPQKILKAGIVAHVIDSNHTDKKNEYLTNCMFSSEVKFNQIVDKNNTHAQKFYNCQPFDSTKSFFF